MPKVSFAVPIYNVAPYIEQCVRSLYEQTLDDIEILLVDDCSLDDSIEIALRALEDYPQRREQVRVIRHNHNMGIAATRKDIVYHSTGDYIMQIDGDDWIDIKTGEVLSQRAVKTQSDAVICDVNIDKCSRYFHSKFTEPMRVGKNGQGIMADILNRRVSSGIAFYLVKRDIYFEKDFVWPKGNYAEDMLLASQVALYAKRIEWVSEGFYYYRYNPKSISHTPTEQQIMCNFTGYQSVVSDWLEIMKRNRVLEKYSRGERMNKIFCRNILLPITNKLKYRRLFFNTYPEINRFYSIGDKLYRPSYREHIFIVTVWLGLYPKFKRILCSKYLRPRKDWSTYTPLC